MITKHEIIKTIVEMSEGNEAKFKACLGFDVVESCKEVLNREIDLKLLKITNDSITYLLNKIEENEQTVINMILHNEKCQKLDQIIAFEDSEFTPYYRAINQDKKLLKSVIEKL